MKTYTVEFEIKPSVFQELLSSVQKHINVEAGGGNVFVAAIKKDSDLYYEQGCFTKNKGPIETDRVVLGIAGEGTSHRFVEGPAVSVDVEGMFLFKEPNQIKKWARHVDSNIVIEYGNKGGATHWIELSHKDGTDRISIQQFYYADQFSKNFSAHQERFDPPDTSFFSEKAAKMFSMAASIAPKATGGGRVGDLSFTQDGKRSCVEFLTVQEFGKPTVASSQTEEFESSAFGDVEWEVQTRHLSFLAEVLGNESTTATTLTHHIEGAEKPYMSAQFSHRYVKDDVAYYVQTQYYIQRDHVPIRSLLPTDNIFQNPLCRLYATCQTKPFLQVFEQIWALRETKLVQSARDKENNKLVLQSDETEHESHTKEVDAQFGKSEIESFLFMPYVQSMVESFLNDSVFFQIRSFPMEGEEMDNVYILLPVPEDAQTPTDRISNPKRHLIINWHSE